MASDSDLLIDAARKHIRDLGDNCTDAAWLERGLRNALAGLPQLAPADLDDLLRWGLGVYVAMQRDFHVERARLAAAKRRQAHKAPNQFGGGYGFKLVGRRGHRHAVPDLAEREVMGRIVELREQGY